MAAPTFNLTANAERKAFALYIDVSESSTPEWEVQGYGTEDASVAFSPDTSSLIDILGIQHNQVNSLTRAMSITPNTIRPIENFGKLNELLHEYTRRNQLTKLSTFKVLLVYWYTTNSAADLYPTCTVVPGTSITYTFSALLSIDVGDTYKVIVNPTLDNHTGKEEIILEIGGTALPAVDNLGRYVTAQM
ncbi:MAG: hypothetical protein FWD71_21660, partial [Oscillospiraceae bacterium]|nr:hypothetical protein [Oscillospiraceae bacterium]